MAPVPPILSTAEDLVLPDLENILSGSAIPASADLGVLNESLATLASAAQARADALRRDVQLLQQTYASLKLKVRRELDVANKATSMSRQSSIESHSDQLAGQAPMMKKRKSELSFATPVSKIMHTPFRQPSPSVLPTPRLPLPDRAVPTVELATTDDPEELKRRLGVAFYPTQDLSHLLPGRPSTEDYSKQKIPNQVAMSTFQASIDPYFRPFTEEDLGWLRDHGEKLTPFIVPPLGTHYTELWQDPADEAVPKQESSQKAKESADVLTDDNVATDVVSCGPLTSRLLSAFIKEDGNSSVSDEKDVDKERMTRASVFKMDYPELEEKVNAELNFIGLIEADSIDWNQTADDEISAELRMLQDQLHVQMKENTARKQVLMTLTTDEMAKDEYTTILEDLDKQVEQAFLKRTRNLKATKKKRGPGEKGVALSKVGIGSNIRSLLEKRHKWITRIGSICTTEPVGEESVFQGSDDEKDSDM